MAIDPSRSHLYPMFEGAVGEDDPQDVRILEFDLRTHRYTHNVRGMRLEMPGAKVNLAGLTPGGGRAGVPRHHAADRDRRQSAPELTAVNSHEFLALERDGAGDGVAAPRFKKVFLIDMSHTDSSGYVDKQLLVDLMAVPDPAKIGGDGDFFRFPFNTIESVHVDRPGHDPRGERQQLSVLQRPIALADQRTAPAHSRRTTTSSSWSSSANDSTSTSGILAP